MNQQNKSLEELAKEYADNKVPNPSPNDAPYYTTGDRWDDIYQTYKDAFTAASPKGKGEGDEVEFLEWCFGQGYVLYADHMPFYYSPILYEKFKQSKIITG